MDIAELKFRGQKNNCIEFRGLYNMNVYNVSRIFFVLL
jgi:hypothetical protein